MVSGNGGFGWFLRSLERYYVANRLCVFMFHNFIVLCSLLYLLLTALSALPTHNNLP